MIIRRACAAAGLALLVAIGGDAAARQKLSKDDQVLHALDRLTFGPRPGDVERVNRTGLKKWLDQQLHPRHRDRQLRLQLPHDRAL